MRSRKRSSALLPPPAWQRVTAWLALATFGALPPSAALAAPQGAEVQHGSASFETNGNTTTIRTSTPVTIIDYRSFDIQHDEAVHIYQPGVDSRVMNRVLPTDPTRIDGELWSNGQVYLLNAAGIFFGNEAIVDVGRLVAAAGSLSNADFIAGIDRFTDLAGAVGNDGLIEADSVALIGRAVANHGTIIAEGGMIALVAGDQVLLSKIEGRIIVKVDGPAGNPDEFAVQQTGTLDAGTGSVSLVAGDTWSLAINHTGITRGGDIRIEGERGIVQVAGTLDASNRGSQPGVGGRIEVTGEKVAIGDALLDASGEAGGGEIHVGGDVRGEGQLRTARRTYVSPDAVLRADASGAGDGGEVVVWSDEWTLFRGSASARGGAAAGDGGFVEISGRALEVTGNVDLSAPNGRGGTLLYDPERIVIEGGVRDGSDVDQRDDRVVGDDGTESIVLLDDEGVFDPDVPDGTFVIYESEIEGAQAGLLILEAEKSVTAGETDSFSDGVQLQDEVILSIATIGSSDEQADNDDLRGIDLRGIDPNGAPGQLVWKAGEGGAIVLVTGLDQSGQANIIAHKLESRSSPAAGGSAVFIQAGGGDVDIDEIDTRADPTRGGAGGAVTILTARFDVDVNVDTILTMGSDALPAGSGGNESDLSPGTGGGILIAPIAAGASSGNIAIGHMNTSGGNATDVVPGAGGSAGVIDISTENGDIVLGAPGAGDVAIVANGGLAVMTDPREDVGPAGGAAAVIRLNLVESSDSIGNQLRVIGDVEARGGDLMGIEGDRGALGSGGIGGRMTVATNGVAQLGTPTESIAIDLSGGSALGSAPQDVGNGGPAGTLDVTVGGSERPSGLLVNATIDAVGGTSRNGTSGSGGQVFIDSRFGPVVGFSDAGVGFASAIDVSGGNADGVDTSEDADGRRQFDAIASGGGSVDIFARNGLTWGTIRGRTGSAAGGTVDEDASGARVNLGVERGSLSIAGVDVSGGSAGGTESSGSDPLFGRGGDAGQIELIALNTEGRADVVLVEGHVPASGALLMAAAGEGADPTDAADGAAGRIGVSAETAILVDSDAANAPYAHVAGGDVLLLAQAVGESGTPVEFAGAGTDADSVSIRIERPLGEDDPRIDDAVHAGLVFGRAADPGFGEVDHFKVRQIALDGETFVDGITDGSTTSVLVVEGADELAGLPQRITTLDSSALVTGIEYRLDVLGGESSSPADLGIATSAQVGSGGLLLATTGQLLGLNPGTVITSAGDLVFGEAGLEPTLVAADLGSGLVPLEIETVGAPLIAVTVAGDVSMNVALSGQTANDGVGGVAIIQKDLRGSVDITLPGLDRVDIKVDDQATPTASVVNELTTTSTGADFLYELGGNEFVGAPAAEGDVVVKSADLGGTTILIAKGDIVLDGGANTAIAAGDEPLALLATGAILSAGDGIDIADASSLLLVGNAGAGSAADAIQLSGDADVSFAAQADGGDLVVVKSGAGDLRVTEFVAGSGEADDPFNLVVHGVSAGGDVELTNSGHIVFTGESGERGVESFSTARAGGNLELNANILLETFLAPQPDGEGIRVRVNETRLVAGGDIVLNGSVEASAAGPVDPDPPNLPLDPVAATLILTAGGATSFAGDVGASGGIARLETTDVRVAQDILVQVSHDDVAGGADFNGTIDGPGALTLVALGAGGQESVVAFRGDIGVQSRLRGLDVDADSIVFTDADRVVTGDGGIALNAGRMRAEVPTVATISDAVNSVSFETSGTFATGNREKLSVVGDLGIQAATARFGDLAADTIRVEAPKIELMGRSPGLVRTTTGIVMDRGVDLVANDMVFSSPIEWDGVGPTPTLVLGSGGVVVPGSLAGFRVIRLDSEINAVTRSDFGSIGAVLDLTGNGPPLVADPTQEIPRIDPQVEPVLPARVDDAAPAGMPDVSESELLAYLRCVEVEGESPCGAERARAVASVSNTSPLATPRAAQIAAGYRALIENPDARARLFSSFSVALRGYRELSGPGPVGGAGLYRFLAESPPHREARSYIDELARLSAYVQLMGLAPAEVSRVQRELAEEFARTAGVAGLDADVVAEAVGASGIGVPPPRLLRENV